MKYLFTVPGSLSECGQNQDILLEAAGNALDPETNGEDAFFCCSDPREGHLGSGGGTTYLLQQCYATEKAKGKIGGDVNYYDWLRKEPRVLIHAGGQSRRLPSYGPAGKILTPLPIFRSMRGQSIDQTLLTLQIPLFESIMKAVPSQLNTLIACGDVFIQNSKPLRDLHQYKDVDVLCFGLWKDSEVMKNHGVYFMRRDSPEDLDFMLQKPSLDQIHDHSLNRVYLMDIGLWVLSDRALALLQARSSRAGGGLKEYDLYGEFGCALGLNARVKDPELNQLKVKILALPGGKFYHYGTNNDLINSTLAIEKAAKELQDPMLTRSLMDTKAKAHPSIFPQNALVRTPYTAKNTYLWLENSCIGPRWTLRSRQIVTGVPENDWELDLAEGACIGVCPVPAKQAVALQPDSFTASAINGSVSTLYAARVYGYNDAFKGRVSDPATEFLGQPLASWLASHAVDVKELTPCRGEGAGKAEVDLQFAHLFPCCDSVDSLGLVLRWMLNPAALPEAERATASGLWRSLPRVSAADLNDITDMGAVVAQRRGFQKKILPLMASQHALNTFYQTDLNIAARQFVRMRLALPAPLNRDEKREEELSMKAIHYNMFCARILEYAQREMQASGSASTVKELLGLYQCASEKELAQKAAAYESMAFEILRLAMVQSISSEKQEPKLSMYDDQIVWGRSPARIDLSGGWTDTPPYSVMCGGSVVNIAIELNGQPPIQVYVKLRDSPDIIIRSIDLGTQDLLTSFDDIRQYNQVGSAFSIPKAALALAGFLPEFCATPYTSLQEQLKASFNGKGLEVTLLVAIPAGSGLGTSSIVAGTVLQALSECCGLNWDASAVCRRVLILEQLLTTGGGWQDQYGGLFSGVKIVQSVEGFRQDPSVRWLPEGIFSDIRYKPCHLLYYTGITRTAKKILAEIVRGMFLNDATRLRVLREMSHQTTQLYDAMTSGDFHRYGTLIANAWDQNKRLDSGTCTPEVQAILDRIEPYMLGMKLAGAGGGGYMYIVAKDEDCARRIREELTTNPPNTRARFVDMALSSTGIQVSRS